MADRPVIWAVAVLVAIALAPLLGPFDPLEQVDPPSSRLRPPGTRLWIAADGDGGRLAGDELVTGAEGLSLRRLGELRPVIANPDPVLRRHLLGTDRYGRDLLSRLISGGRRSVGVAAIAIAIAVALGLGIGGLAARGGQLLDGLLMRGTDVFLAFPRLYLVLAVAAYRPATALEVAIILGCTSWMGLARLVRAELVTLAATDFALAARAAGASPLRLVLRHELPLLLPLVFVEATLRFADTILLEGALSFLGFGVGPPHATWGTLVAEALDLFPQAWWIAVFPGLALAGTVLVITAAGRHLERRLDPRSEPRFRSG